MRPEAEKILETFHDRGVEAGDYILWEDFSQEVIPFEAGFISDEGVRQGFIELREAGMIIEAANAVELTEAGQRHIEQHLAS